MYKIAYIEPCKSLLHHSTRTPYLVLNIFFHNRLHGIERAVMDNPELDVEWINNNISVSQFIKNGEHRAFDAVLLTSPDEKTLKAIAEVDDDTIFLASQDHAPDTDINCVIPDTDKDVRTVLAALSKEGVKKITLVAAYIKPKTLNMIDSFKRLMGEYHMEFDPGNIIGIDLEQKKALFTESEHKAKWRFFLDEIMARRGQTDCFVFVDTAEIMSVYRKLITDHGLRIPEDIKLASMLFSGQFPGPFYQVAARFSHITQDYKTLGQLSIVTISEILAGKRPKKGNIVRVPGIFTPGISISNEEDTDKNDALLFKANISSYIKHHYMDHLSGSQIAKDLELNYSYFLTKFRNTFGMGLQTYINNVRLDKAAHLIANTDRNLTNIYFDVGYKNATTFVRQFKKRFEKNPSEYRKFCQVNDKSKS